MTGLQVKGNKVQRKIQHIAINVIIAYTVRASLQTWNDMLMLNMLRKATTQSQDVPKTIVVRDVENRMLSLNISTVMSERSIQNYLVVTSAMKTFLLQVRWLLTLKKFTSRMIYHVRYVTVYLQVKRPLLNTWHMFTTSRTYHREEMKSICNQKLKRMIWIRTTRQKHTTLVAVKAYLIYNWEHFNASYANEHTTINIT